MKKSIFILVSITLHLIATAQSEMIKRIFRILPAKKVYDLSIATRDSMLQGKTYYPAINDSTEIAAYNYGFSTDTREYMYVSLSFETDQRGTGMIEIRSFKMKSGTLLVLLSQTGGIPGIAYEQHEISGFLYGKDIKLIPYNKSVLPKASINLFLKPGAPASVKKAILENSNIVYDLSQQQVQLNLNSIYNSDDPIMKKWLKGDHIYFDWKQDKFMISSVRFE